VNQDYLSGLIDGVEELRTANESGDETRISAGWAKLSAHAKSAETLWEHLDACKDRFGATTKMKNVIDAVKGARKSWGGPGFYGALWNMLATDGCIAETKRWLEASEPPAAAEQQKPKDMAKCHHTPDFTTVNWYGEEYHFNETEAKCVALLWAEWEKNPSGKPALHQRKIRDVTGSENPDFRLIHVFRHRNGQHRAWGRMIQTLGRGMFYLGKPTSPVTPRQQAKKAGRKTKRKPRFSE
jgi:hypothetical protein